MNRFSLGLFLGVLLAGCASATFPYKYYYVDGVTSPLLGHEPKDDLPAATCNKDALGNHTCTVMLKSEYEAMILDYLDLQDKLIQCQRSCKP